MLVPEVEILAPPHQNALGIDALLLVLENRKQTSLTE
jgi:hypothetical protein